MMRDIVKLLRSSLSCKIDNIIPEKNFTRVLDSRFNFDNCCRPEGVIEEFFSAAPGNLDRFSG